MKRSLGSDFFWGAPPAFGRLRLYGGSAPVTPPANTAGRAAATAVDNFDNLQNREPGGHRPGLLARVRCARVGGAAVESGLARRLGLQQRVERQAAHAVG